MKKKNYFKEFIDKLDELHIAYPKDNIGRHLSMAFADYSDLWTVSDRELVFALEKYQLELELDHNQIAPEEYVKKIQEDAEHLFDEIEEEDI